MECTFSAYQLQSLQSWCLPTKCNLYVQFEIADLNDYLIQYERLIPLKRSIMQEMLFSCEISINSVLHLTVNLHKVMVSCNCFYHHMLLLSGTIIKTVNLNYSPSSKSYFSGSKLL